VLRECERCCRAGEIRKFKVGSYKVIKNAGDSDDRKSGVRYSKSMQKRLVSGVKPTGDIHIGNYFGAMRQFLELAEEYDSFIFIADLHGLNQVHDAKQLSQGALDIAKTFLAIGLDPKKVTLFRQSDVPAVAELCWIFNSITPLSMLQLAHAYKDAKAKGTPINMGLFDYPVLMAADILLYNADVVPVGQDQQQHIEMTREIAKIFNHTYGKTFKLPEGYISNDVAVVKGLDGRKMSKSYGNTIGLFDSEAVLKKKVMSIVTDSRSPSEPKDPETCNIFSLHKLFSEHMLKELRKRYVEGGISYKESKELLFENMNSFLVPIREKKEKLDKDPAYVQKVLREGKERAEAVAEKTIAEVRKKVGL
jgi:tryptophanyl-tRNA synthetase